MYQKYLNIFVLFSATLLLGACGSTPMLPKISLKDVQSKETAKEKIDAPIDNKGTTYLMSATQYGDVEAVTYLLKSGADPNARNNEGKTALHYAMDCDIQSESDSKNKIAVTSLLLKYKADPNLRDTAEDLTPLMWQARGGFGRGGTNHCTSINKDLALMLIDAGYDLSISTPWGKSHWLPENYNLLHIGIRLGSMSDNDAIAILERYGEQQSRRNKGNKVAARNAILNIISMHTGGREGSFRSVTSIGTPVTFAAYGMRAGAGISRPGRPIDFIHYALDVGYNPNYQDGGGNTLLHIATKRYNATKNPEEKNEWGKVVKHALEKGANTKIVNFEGEDFEGRKVAGDSGGFQWGKFAALAAGTAIGGQGLAEEDKVKLLMGNAFDSRAGVEGMQSTQAGANQVQQDIAQRREEQAAYEREQQRRKAAIDTQAANSERLLSEAHQSRITLNNQNQVSQENQQQLANNTSKSGMVSSNASSSGGQNSQMQENYPETAAPEPKSNAQSTEAPAMNRLVAPKIKMVTTTTTKQETMSAATQEDACRWAEFRVPRSEIIIGAPEGSERKILSKEACTCTKLNGEDGRHFRCTIKYTVQTTLPDGGDSPRGDTVSR